MPWAEVTPNQGKITMGVGMRERIRRQSARGGDRGNLDTEGEKGPPGDSRLSGTAGWVWVVVLYSPK